MVNQQVLAHHWDEVCERLREKYNRLSDDDLPSFPGNVDQLIGKIHQKTGVSREAVEAFLAELTEEGQEMADSLRGKMKEGAEMARQKIHDATTKASDAAHQGAQAVREGYHGAGAMIRRRPGQSMVAAFGLGMVCGLGVALLLRGSRPTPPSPFARRRSSAEQFGRQLREQIREAVASHMPMR
jgi:uncharacterized protein YjbJ (UPF0337 family)